MVLECVHRPSCEAAGAATVRNQYAKLAGTSLLLSGVAAVEEIARGFIFISEIRANGAQQAQRHLPLALCIFLLM